MRGQASFTVPFVRASEGIRAQGKVLRIHLLNEYINEYSLCLAQCLAPDAWFIKVYGMNRCLLIISLEKLERWWRS